LLKQFSKSFSNCSVLIIYSLENLQISSNHDGTVNIKVTEKSVYFQEVANELHKTYNKYSDVKIVCGDGSRFDANRSILARLKHLSRYFLLPEIPTGESKAPTINKPMHND